MYYSTLYKNFSEIKKGLESKNIILRLSNGCYSKIMQEYGKKSWIMQISYVLPFLLPFMVLMCICFFYKNSSVFLALPIYLFLPYFIPIPRVIAMAMTILGLFGLVWDWPPLVVGVFTPGLFSLGGIRVWQFVIQASVVRMALQNEKIFERLWKEKLIALQDKEGIHQYREI
ncbi:hypothetical protein [Clostridium sp. HCS.1]|uniref:hypothetical protein n=1 Tax=Clostridium sp. HCS.1 TaxID=3238594 RepID=UPI003A10273F